MGGAEIIDKFQESFSAKVYRFPGAPLQNR